MHFFQKLDFKFNNTWLTSLADTGAEAWPTRHALL